MSLLWPTSSCRRWSPSSPAPGSFTTMNEWMKWWMDEWMNECTWTPGRVYPLLELLSSVPSSPLIFLFLLLFSQSSPKHKNLQVNHIPIPIPSTRLEPRLDSTQIKVIWMSQNMDWLKERLNTIILNLNLNFIALKRCKLSA